MSKILDHLEVELDESLQEKLQWLYPDFTDYRILRQSVDARGRRKPKFIYRLEVAEKGEKLNIPEIKLEQFSPTSYELPIIIGTGPAGLFAALRFVERGIRCRIFERGSQAEARIRGINRFWRYGELDPRNNVCYGEGGAGLYSDGKLITGIKSSHIPYVLDRLVQFGAPAEIRYLANPHVGSDKIRRVIPFLRKFLIEHGCEMHFDTKVTELLTDNHRMTGIKTEKGDVFHSKHIVLATGHSAEDMLLHLKDIGVHLDGKSFAVGLRIEHPQKLINQIQYKEASEHPALGAANYKVVDHDHQTKIGVYSFCMCPGGYVLSSGTEIDGVVCNGMSNFRRNSAFANSAIVVSIDHDKNFPDDLLGGLNFRRELEQAAFTAVQKNGGRHHLPAQKLTDFFSGKTSPIAKTSSPSGVTPVRLDQLLPSWMKERVKLSLNKFNQNLKGFIHEDAILYGMETRTSCPVRVTRSEDSLESISHQGLYPCGEGAGYAGGITSAACDGVRIAEKICENLTQKALPL